MSLLYTLVGGFNHLEKYEFVNGKDDIPYVKWKIKAIFETTNQQRFVAFFHVDPFWLIRTPKNITLQLSTSAAPRSFWVSTRPNPLTQLRNIAEPTYRAIYS